MGHTHTHAVTGSGTRAVTELWQVVTDVHGQVVHNDTGGGTRRQDQVHTVSKLWQVVGDVHG